MKRFTLPSFLLLGALALLPALVRADVKSGREALLHGKWTEAEQAFKTAPEAEKGQAALGLAELYLTTGKYDEALQQAKAAEALPGLKAHALCLEGEVQNETGKTEEAIKSFQAAAAADAKDLRARVSLGVTLKETARRAEGEKILGQVHAELGAGKVDKSKVDQLTYAAMAARGVRAWQDANGAFQDAAEKDPNFLLANLEWGDLFLLKYNAEEASKCLTEVLKLNPNLPRALVGMGNVRAEAGDLRGAIKLADAALKQNPKYGPALSLKARMALDDEDFKTAEGFLKQALDVNPVDLDALALLAASRYLQDDTPGYEAANARALKQNPTDGDFYYIVAELAERGHRYADAVALGRQGIAIDPKNSNALSALGTNLLRLGMAYEKEGLKFVNQAFKEDPFNVRTFNTLNLYDEVIAKEYETVPGPTFIYRFNKKEKPMLQRYVPPLMQRAWDGYIKKYGFTPKHPITVELFAERQHYGARTVGLPEFGAQGTCFGELITAMSPACAEANWEQVLWHELAHVFHIQLSKNRVSRWFTEGLAEYETNVERPYWKREYAHEIFLSMKHGEMWKIGELSAAFTHPDRENGVILAYQQSSMVVHCLADTYGFPKIVEALKLYGEGKQDSEVLQTVTGKPLAKLDEEFVAWLKKRYSYYEKGFWYDRADYADAKKLKEEADAKPNDAEAQARYAASMKEPAMMLAQAQKAVLVDPMNGLAHFLAGEASLALKDKKTAKAELEQVLALGTDGYIIHYHLGKLLAEEGDIDGAAKEMAAAKKWDPDESDPYKVMMELYESKDRRDDLLKEAEGYLDLEEHDHDAARLLIDRYSADRRWADIIRVAPRVLGITPNEAFVHQQYGYALAETGNHKEALFELESAIDCGVRRPGVVRGLMALEYLKLGDKVKAKALALQAIKEVPNNQDAQQVLKQVQ